MKETKITGFFTYFTVLFLALFLLLPSSAYAESAVKIFLNGQELKTDVPAVIEKDRTMVPIRAISEGLGMHVHWDGENNLVQISREALVDDNLKNKQELENLGAPIIFIDGVQLLSDVDPFIINGRTMVPLRAISERLGMQVDWENTKRQVKITNIIEVPIVVDDPVQVPDEKVIVNYLGISILGESVATADELMALARKYNPDAPNIAELFIKIGREYGIRGDIAFLQSAHETGWWKYGGLVVPEQHNYCGLGATGAAATANMDMHGANPKRVWYIEGMHGAYFDTPATGVEAQIQHLYAYATTKPLPAGKDILSPRYRIIESIGRRGLAPNWEDLGGKWAVPGYDPNRFPGPDGFNKAFAEGGTYGQRILDLYFQTGHKN